MAVVSHRRLINPRLGTYFGIFASSMAGLVLLLLIFERLGVSQNLLRWAMLLGPILIYAVIGAATYAREPAEYFAAGRRVPAVYTGLVMAGSALGATSLVAITGLFFVNGFDAWCLAIGVWAGFVAMALLVAPYLRKFGAYTVPSYLGRRLDNRLVRLVSAGIFLVPMVLVAAAELKMGAAFATQLSGGSLSMVTFLLVVTVMVCTLFGGMRSLTWTNVAMAIAALLALVVPVAVVAAIETNLPLPQLSHGTVLRGIGRLEAMQGVPTPLAPAFAIDFAGTGLHTLGHRMAQTYASVGPIAFILISVTLLCGLATAPWLSPRYGCTPGVYEARKSTAWAIVFAGLILLTSASIAVFMRDMVMDQLVGRSASTLPAWFESLRSLGVADVQSSLAQLPLTGFAFKRDAVIIALPIAAGFADVVYFMVLSGIVAAALLGATSVIHSIGTMLAEDGVGGLVWEPPSADLRINIARIATGAVAVVTAWISMFLPADPLDLMIWSLALSASAAFPVLVLSVWWKRLNSFGALAGIVTGFVTALLAIMAGEAAWLGMPGTLAATFGVPAGFAAAILATRSSPAPGRQVLLLVRDMRLPGGETMQDRAARLERLKQQRGP